jgi:Patatin-like phospholipase
MDTNSQSTLNPLRKIALSFSGGGFRATSFCLGSLSYLNYRTIYKDKKETLLSHVQFISSASGGSFANLGYAFYLYSGKTFDECYQALIEFMDGTKLLDVVFQILNDDKIWEGYPDKGRNLINAFSLAYNKMLFFDANLGGLHNPETIKHLREICVNATEFDDGLSFRFQNSDGIKRNGKIGNRNLYLNTNFLDVIGKIRLSDIVASSSCFPGGFEPMIFPNDFTHENLSKQQLSSTIYTNTPSEEHLIVAGRKVNNEADSSVKTIDNQGFSHPELQFALMDGGIDDNQGIQSMILADKRTNEKFDTMIVCDVSSPFMKPYIPPKELKKGILGKYSLTFWERLYFLFWTSVITVGLFEAKNWTLFSIDWKTVLTTLGAAGLAVGVSVYLFVKSKYNKFSQSSWKDIIDKYIGFFMKIRLSALDQMIFSRGESMVKMTTDIFLKQIRRMAFDIFYNNNNYKNKRVTATIYELSTEEFSETEKRLDKKLSDFLKSKKSIILEVEYNNLNDIIETWKRHLKPSKELMEIAQKAREMGTTLWFDTNDQKQNQLDNIISTGQFTMCYNLLAYLFEIQIERPDVFSDSLKELQAKLLEDWQIFNKNPNWLLKAK